MTVSLNSKLLKETIRYHEECGRHLGIRRCELWLYSQENEMLYLWPGRDDAGPTTLPEENIVKHLWSKSKPVLFHSFKSLEKELDIESDPSPPHWISSLPIGPHIGPSLSVDKQENLPRFRGMVCWIGEHGWNSQNHLVEFLESATRHIAQTYSHESCCEGIPVSGQRTSFKTNYLEDKPSKSLLAIAQKSVPEWGDDSDDDFESQSKSKARSTRISLLDEYDGSDDTKNVRDCTSQSLSKLQLYFRKYKGGGKKGPMPLCWRQVLFTFVGSFCTIFFIHVTNQLITSQVASNNSEVAQLNMTTATNGEILRAYYDDYSFNNEWEAFEMGPFGATCVLVFAMTSAAPSQPKIMLFGASIGMVIGKVVGYLDLVGVGIGVRMSLAVALTASIMAVTANLYPPGAALAIIFTSRLLGWERFYLQVIGTVLTFSLGVIINNLHPLRIYPNFWLGCEPKELCQKPSLNRTRNNSACKSIM